MPAATLFSPGLVSRLYAVDPTGDLGLLLRHRGALFLAVVVACIWAFADARVRRLSSVLVALSMGSFLLLYVIAGRPAGALETVARLDLIGLLPLLVVLHGSWRVSSGLQR